MIASRLAECGLELNGRKTRIVYCKSSVRRRSHEHVSFDFLGYTFRLRLSRNKAGDEFVGFLPAVSDDARKGMGREIRHWRLHVRSGTTLADLARSINVIVRGWINFYGRSGRFGGEVPPIASRIACKQVGLTRPWSVGTCADRRGQARRRRVG